MPPRAIADPVLSPPTPSAPTPSPTSMRLAARDSTAAATVGQVPPRRRSQRWWALTVIAVLIAELVAGWPWLVSAFESFEPPVWTWFGLALAADLASMGAYARMQRRLLRVGGTAVSLPSATALAYASHSLSDTLPGGPAFSAVFSFRKMRRHGASAGVASWVIAFSGVMSAGALVAIGLAAGILATGSTDGWALLGYLTAAALLAVVVRVLHQRPGLITRTVARAVALGNRVLRHEPRRGLGIIQGLIADVTAIRIRRRDFVVVAAFASLNWLLDALCLYLCLVAVGVDQAAPVAVVLAYTAGMAALSVPLVPASDTSMSLSTGPVRAWLIAAPRSGRARRSRPT